MSLDTRYTYVRICIVIYEILGKLTKPHAYRVVTNVSVAPLVLENGRVQLYTRAFAIMFLLNVIPM